MALKGPKIDSNGCFIFCIFHHFHQFLAQFGSIFWLELHQYLAFVISWHHLDIPSYPTYPQKLFCSLLITLKWPKIDLAVASKITPILASIYYRYSIGSYMFFIFTGSNRTFPTTFICHWIYVESPKLFLLNQK